MIIILIFLTAYQKKCFNDLTFFDTGVRLEGLIIKFSGNLVVLSGHVCTSLFSLKIVQEL